MISKPPVSIKFIPDEILVSASHEETWLEAGLRENLDIPHSCGGNGTCGTCLVWVVAGLDQLPPRNEIEQEMALDRKFADAERLCCQNLALKNVVLKLR